MLRTVRYRIRANNKKKYEKLSTTTGACRFAWNYFNGELRDDYQKDGYQNSRHEELGNRFTELRKDVNYSWLKDVSSYIVRHSLKNLTLAYERFYSKVSELPKFKSKYKTTPSFPIQNGDTYSSRLNKDYLYIQKIGWLKLTGDNPYPEGIFKSGVVKKECGRWYAYLVYELEDKKEVKRLQGVAVDLNSRQITLSDEEVFKLPVVEPKLEARRRRYERKLARQIKESKQWWITKIKLQKVIKKIHNVYQNWRHWITKQISLYYNVVILEKLNTKYMTTKKKVGKLKQKMNRQSVRSMNKNILNTAWSKIIQFLQYKCKVTVMIDPKYTSQRCSSCGCINEKNRVSQSKFKCIDCGFELNADLNATFNQLEIGKKELETSGIGVSGWGDCRISKIWSVNHQLEHSVLRH